MMMMMMKTRFDELLLIINLVLAHRVVCFVLIEPV
jgi:hypothetical protein